MATALPDREKRHLIQFWMFPSMTYGKRLMLAWGAIAAGMVIQLVVAMYVTPIQAGFLGVPLGAAGVLLLLASGYNLKPDLATSGRWEKTTRARFHEALELEKAVRNWDESLVDVTSATGCIGLGTVLVGGVMGAFYLMAAGATEQWTLVFLGWAGLLVVPHFITGTRRGWKPVSLRQHIESIETALRAIDGFEEPSCQIQPMFQVAGKKDGEQTPLAARAFVRFPDGPDDFLGMQFQTSMNNVQGTRYPYMYAVVVAKKAFGLHNQYDKVRAVCAGLTVERSSEADVDVIVIRQRTTKTSGYHTNRKVIRHIARCAWYSVTQILEGRA
jgi:hypothetical protein